MVFKKNQTPWNKGIKAPHIYRVPTGCIIHHIDLNPHNNNPNNLQLLEDKYHRSLHNQTIKLMKAGGIVYTM